MKKIILTGIFSLLLLFAFGQQSPQYGQYIFNGLYVNPAYAGFKEAMYMQAFYRAQWTGIKGGPQSLTVAFDAPANNLNIGLGAILTKDKIGAQGTISGMANFSYRLRLNLEETNILAFGLGVGVLQTSINGSTLNPLDPNDTTLPVGYESKTIADARVGAQFSTPNFFLGISANNILSKYSANYDERTILNYTVQPHFYLTTSMLFQVHNNLMFKPALLIKDDLNGPTSLDLNAFFIFNDRFWLGGVYRTSVTLYPKNNLQKDLPKQSAIGFITDFTFHQKFRIGYGFDYSLNKLGGYGYGSHEISMGYFFTLAQTRKQKCHCF